MTKPRGRREGKTNDAPGVLLNYKAQGKVLTQFHSSKDFVRIIIGPLGSGKTFGAINDIFARCHRQTPDKRGVRRSHWCIARDSFPNLNAATIPDVRSIVDLINPDGWNMSPGAISWHHSYKRKGDGTTVEIKLIFRAFDGPQDVVKARGMQLTGVWVDELAEFNKANFDMLIGRVKRYPPKVEVPDAKFHVIGTSNACAKDHWLAELALNHYKPPGWWIGIQPGGVVHVGNSWQENPHAENMANLPDGYYQEQCGGKKDSWIRQNLANEFVVHSDGRPVHPDFNEQVHTAPVQATYGIPLHVGIDFGRTPAAAIMQRQANGQWYVLEEICTVNMGADRFGPILRQVLNERYASFNIEAITGDPAGSDMAQTRDETPFDLLRLSGIEAQPAHTNDPEVRYATLDQFLRQLIDGQPAIVVDPSCTTLIRGLGGEYQFRRIQVVGQERYTDKADKGPTSHIVEALHYGLMGAGESETLYEQTWSAELDGLDSYAPDHRYFE